MKIGSSSMILASCFAMSLVHIANGIYCFQCNSKHDPHCELLQHNDTHSKYYKLCETTNPLEPPFCRKSVLNVIMDFEAGPKHERVIRRCGFAKDSRKDRECYRKADKDHQEIHCQCFHDGCNGASSLTKIPIISLLCVIIGLFRSS